MFRPRVIPVLLLKNKGLVKTIKFKNSRYIGDPINAVKVFNDHEADELILLDIIASIEDRTISEVLVEVIGNEAFMPLAVGGGIKTLDDARRLFNSGAEKVVINSSSIQYPNLIGEISRVYGSQSVIVSVDVKKNYFGKYQIYIKCGTKKVSKDIVEHAREMEKMGAGEILVNSIDKDGTMSGYDLSLIKKVTDSVQIPVIACGGAKNLEDFSSGYKICNANALAAGSMFVYHGQRNAVLINYPDKIKLNEIFFE